MKLIKYIINIILSCLIILIILLGIILNLLNNKILNKKYMLEKLDKSEFYTLISREIQKGFENYIYQSGFPEDIINDIATEAMIKKDVHSIINFVYEDTEIELSSSELKNNLDTKIQNYVTEKKSKLSKKENENIENFEELMITEYNNTINASNKFYEMTNDILKKATNIRNQIGIYWVIALVVLIVILILINSKNLLVAINFVGISLLSAGILFKIGIWFIFKNINFDSLLLITESITSVIINISKEILYELLDTGNLLIISGISAIIISAILNNFERTPKVIKPFRRKKRRV